MADTLIRSVHSRVVHDPARIIDSQLDGVPDSWRHTMQLERPAEGINICCMNGHPGSSWAFEAEGDPAVTLAILLDGHMEAGVQDGAELAMGAGQVLLMAVGERARGWDVLSSPDDFHLVNINLTEQALLGLTGLEMDDVLGCMRASSAGMEHVNACMVTMPAFTTLQRIAGEITRCGHQHRLARRAFVCAKVSEALAAVLDQCTYRQRNLDSRHPRALPSDRSRLIQARTLLEQQYARPWSVRTLCRAVGLNEKRLQAGFQTLYGHSVHDCLTRIRLDAALTLLSSGHSVADTSQAVGFANVSHFGKVFRNAIGITPKRWARGQQPRD